MEHPCVRPRRVRAGRRQGRQGSPWPMSTGPKSAVRCWCGPAPPGERHFEAAAGLLHRAVERGIAAGDMDLVTIASVMRGRALLKSGAMDAGLSLLDEAMVRVLTRMTSPRTTSMMFCAAIGTCYKVQELRRACEWSVALDQWLEELTDSKAPAFGNSRIYRAMLIRLHQRLATSIGGVDGLPRPRPRRPTRGRPRLVRTRRDAPTAGRPGCARRDRRAAGLGRLGPAGPRQTSSSPRGGEGRPATASPCPSERKAARRFLLLPTLIAGFDQGEQQDKARASSPMAEADEGIPLRHAHAGRRRSTSEALTCWQGHAGVA